MVDLTSFEVNWGGNEPSLLEGDTTFDDFGNLLVFP